MSDTIVDSASREYWTRHNVSLHRGFADAEESSQYLRWRNAPYHFYEQLMPLQGFDDLTIVDYGCGPGHDLVGFATLSRPRHLIGLDISPSSLAQAGARLALHGASPELHQLDDTSVGIPLESNSVDYVHSSGVLHHTPRPDLILQELYRILKPGGRCRIMVYNHESLWMHLYVAYQKRLLENLHADVPLERAFRFFTDGPECPISRAYRPSEWLEIVRAAGFRGAYAGSAISLWECQVFQNHRFQALMDERFKGESRELVTNLTLDHQGFARHGDTFAGVDACYLLQKPT